MSHQAHTVLNEQTDCKPRWGLPPPRATGKSSPTGGTHAGALSRAIVGIIVEGKARRILGTTMNSLDVCYVIIAAACCREKRSGTDVINIISNVCIIVLQCHAFKFSYSILL